MDYRPNVQLNQRKIAFQVRLQERPADAYGGVQGQDVHRQASLQYRRGEAFIAIERGQVCLERGDRSAGPQLFRRFVDPIVGNDEDFEVLLSADLRELIADAGRPSGDHSELPASICVHGAS